jgi:general secretion pathway protein H
MTSFIWIPVEAVAQPASGWVIDRNTQWKYRLNRGAHYGFDRAGFTLIETMIALLVVGFIAALASPYARRISPSARLEGQAAKVLSVFRATRASAIRSNSEQGVIIDTKRYIVSSPATTIARLDPDIDIRVVFADLERRSSSEGGVRFFPNGQSTGAKLLLSLGHLTTTVRVNWATGYAGIEK